MLSTRLRDLKFKDEVLVVSGFKTGHTGIVTYERYNPHLLSFEYFLVCGEGFNDWVPEIHLQLVRRS